MALENIGTWKGKTRTIGGFKVYTQYDIWQDTAGAQASRLYPNEFIFSYDQDYTAFKAMIPFKVDVEVNSVKRSYAAYSFGIGGVMYAHVINPNDPAGNVGTYLEIPRDGSMFQIKVTITPRAGMGTPVTFTEQAHGTVRNLISGPTTMNRYCIHNYNFTATPAGDAYKSSFYFLHNSGDSWVKETGWYNEGWVYENVSGSISSAQIVPLQPVSSNSFEEGDDIRQDIVWLQVTYTNTDFPTGAVITGCRLAIASYVEQPGGTRPDPYFEVDQSTGKAYRLEGSPTVISSTDSGDIRYIQNISEISIIPYSRSRYGTGINRLEISDPANGITTVMTYPDFVPYETTVRWDGGQTRVFTLTFTLYNNVGGSATMTAEIPVVPYSPPKLQNFTVHRCSSASSPSSSDYIDAVSGRHYIPDDEGQYCAIITQSEFTSFAIDGFTPTAATENTKTVSVNPQNEATTSQAYSYTPQTYRGYSYCRVVDAPTEISFDILATLTDRFCFDSQTNPRGAVQYSVRLSTAGVLMDFKRGGKGVALGKISEYDKFLEVGIHWDMRVYHIKIGNYVPYSPTSTNQVGTEIDLITWMRRIEERIAALQQS